MSQTNVADTSLKIEREFAAPVEEVYTAWTDAEQMKQWMGPGEVHCDKVQIDLQVGGKYRIHMVTSDCENPVAIGEYKEIVPNKRLQFTWSWEGGEMPDTLVTVDFEDAGGSTKIILTHENFPAREAAEKHNEGWTGCLESLSKFVS